MTVAKLRELANAAGYEIKRGFIHSEEGSRKAGQSGYELISMETGEAVTHSACGETWHFAYTLEEIESFLQDVYRQAEMNWEPENGATLEDVYNVSEDERLHKKAMELLSISIDAEDTAAEMKKCREMCEPISRNVADVWKDEELNVDTIRMKLLMISWVLDTPEFGLGGGENLLDLAYAMAKERVLQLEHDAPYADQEASDASVE
ncbi:MAG: hypothetical protein MR966_14340 [Lachnospiraceae bacterium]|nr:hypothetical protein [Lachnospiraceae bacterium]